MNSTQQESPPVGTDYDEQENVHLNTENESSTALTSASSVSLNNGKPQNISSFTLDESSSLGQRLERYYFRGLISIFLPLTLVVYYYLTYFRWLRFSKNSGRGWNKKGYLDNAEFVNYSWFVIGIFALNLGTYAMSGSIASMTMTNFWSPKNLRRLLELASNTYADFAAWVKSLIGIVKTRSIDKDSNGKTWNFFAILSILGFIAWPLTGLTMQTVDGYALDGGYGYSGGIVAGLDEETFDATRHGVVYRRAFDLISSGTVPQIPGGQLYTKPDSSISLNVTGRNTLPEDGTDTIFLTVQAETPIRASNVFGILIRYNCTVATTINDFTILNLRKNKTRPITNARESRDISKYMYPTHENDSTSPTIMILDKWKYPLSDVEQNLGAVMEVGTSFSIENLITGSNLSYGGYINTSPTSGMGSSTVLEVALWQNITKRPYRGGGVPDVRGVENEITELTGAHAPGKAIGVRCSASSDTGTADIDGTTATYSNFKAKPPIDSRGGDWTYLGLKRFERGVLHLLTSTSKRDFSGTIDEPDQDGVLFENTWYFALWRATGLYWKTAKASQASLGAITVIQAEDLRSIITRLHHVYAVTIMYDGSSLDTSRLWAHPRVRASTKATILVRGAVPPEIVLALLTIWAVGIVTLAVVYQFRRRWTEKVSTFDAFKFGVHRPEGIRPGDVVSKKDFEKLPGTIGDTNTGDSIGRIGLTRGRGSKAIRSEGYA